MGGTFVILGQNSFANKYIMQSYDFGKAFASWYRFNSKLSFNSFQTKNLHEEKKK